MENPGLLGNKRQSLQCLVEAKFTISFQSKLGGKNEKSDWVNENDTLNFNLYQFYYL
jgi:hypothetical protein